MKKARLALMAFSLAGILLAGCGSREVSKFSPADSCVYVAQDGAVSSALVKTYEGQTVDEKDLRQYLEAAVIRYNKDNGGQEAAGNLKGSTTKLPAAIQSLTVKDGVMKVIFDYASTEDLVKFRQTGDNMDISNTVSAVEVKALTADAAGDAGLTAGLMKADGQTPAAEELAVLDGATLVTVTGGGNVMFPGKVLFVTDGVEKIDDYTVKTPDGETTGIVFK